ncbi:MAG: ATP-dependent sacrificial sulfur transferase LarE, partial [Deltaproteobacteria bacterium]|nr:ATP-dependent sacrificial sulfur transferase LarE [Deltaproteobacteria bacterium]
IGAEHRLVPSREMGSVAYVANAADRCFHCRTELYRLADEKRREWGLAVILNGTNADDPGDYRPGLRAAERAGVRSPLCELGFGKNDVRAAALALGLELWDKPAAACLASRIPYGTQVTAQRLAQIEGLEASLRELGFRQVRVRHHGEIARIEVAPEMVAGAAEATLRARIVAAGKRHGFRYVALDLTGYRQGSLNEGLPERL